MKTDTPSARLMAKLDFVHPSFAAFARKLWHGPDPRAVYPIYLRTMHTIVRSAVPLMEAALAEARARSETDPLSAGLAQYLEHHIEEESGHDDWLLMDLAATGEDPKSALDQIPSRQSRPRRLPRPRLAAGTAAEELPAGSLHRTRGFARVGRGQRRLLL